MLYALISIFALCVIKELEIYKMLISGNVNHVRLLIKQPTLALKPRECVTKSKTGVSVAP